ncbi:hypothetical protein VE01_07400 [Pseudogymnoascus verrucosus]|uniref:Uncharacterized protein n=1 Tax=Pseudogymnoascus verrucosus TaxID=342668 RepID=A0A1B8GGQ9_9PEZI|nr:uncharacterized protein VE01_07400 [Pseudogymnoascus verrucosus]OBT95029.1 hypothetical protein VE01_07400 [Pseudogymnoascus verrucosus]
MPPKRKAPLATADANTLDTPALKKATKGKRTTNGAPSAPAAQNKYKYSGPGSMVNQGPVDITFVMWPGIKGTEEEEVEDDKDDEEDDKPESGSLQETLDGIENERRKAVNEAINARMNNNTVSSSEIRNIRDEKSKPFEKKAEQARKKFLKAKTMTAEEARATVGVDDATRNEKTKAKKNCQERLNEICRERNMAVHNALNSDKKSYISVREGQARIAKAEKRFLKKMDECRGAVAKYTPLTMEEAKEIVPNVEVDDEGNEITKKSAAQAKKDARTKTFVPPRVVTDEGLPVSRAGMEKFIEINQEIDKRNQDVHGLYIYNDFSGYGVTEVMENLLAEFNKSIFKKDISPLKKWAIVEGLTLYLTMGDLRVWMMNDDSEGIEEVFNMMGVMFVTALEMLHESALIGPTSPLPDNVGVLSLLFLNFVMIGCTDYDLEWAHEVVRAADEYGVVLTPMKQVEDVTQDRLDELRDICEKTKKGKGLFWKTEYPKFKRDHPGGRKYDITKMSTAQKAQYEFGNVSEDSEVEDLD